MSSEMVAAVVQALVAAACVGFGFWLRGYAERKAVAPVAGYPVPGPDLPEPGPDPAPAPLPVSVPEYAAYEYDREQPVGVVGPGMELPPPPPRRVPPVTVAYEDGGASAAVPQPGDLGDGGATVDLSRNVQHKRELPQRVPGLTLVTNPPPKKWDEQVERGQVTAVLQPVRR